MPQRGGLGEIIKRSSLPDQKHIIYRAAVNVRDRPACYLTVTHITLMLGLQSVQSVFRTWQYTQ